jgi:Domain of unknown function (DUF4383)
LVANRRAIRPAGRDEQCMKLPLWKEDTMSRSVNQLAGYGLGAVYVAVGLIGFTVSGGHAFAGHEGGHLLGIFAVNGLHNVVHLLVGAALIGAAASGVKAAKGVNTLVGAVYLVVGLLGLVVGNGDLNLLALNAPDHALHFASAIALLAIGLAGDRAGSGRTAPAQHWSGHH